MRGPSQEAASQKVISSLLLSIGQAAKKTLLDKLPQNATTTLPVLLDQVEQNFIAKQLRSLDGFRFFSQAGD